MTRSSRAIALAAVLFTVSLAAPAAANAARVSQRADGGVEVVATESGRGWLGGWIDAAWGWLSALVDEDNGSIMP